MRSKIVNQPGYSRSEFSFGASRPTTSQPDSAIPKKYPGCTQTPAPAAPAPSVRRVGCAGIRSTAYQPPPSPACAPPADLAQLSVQLHQVCRHPLPNLSLNLAPPFSHCGSAHCTGAFIERKVSAITSRRSRPAKPLAPVATIQAAFICGSPQSCSTRSPQTPELHQAQKQNCAPLPLNP
jgi:hypothetical protein